MLSCRRAGTPRGIQNRYLGFAKKAVEILDDNVWQVNKMGLFLVPKKWASFGAAAPVTQSSQ